MPVNVTDRHLSWSLQDVDRIKYATDVSMHLTKTINVTRSGKVIGSGANDRKWARTSSHRRGAPLGSRAFTHDDRYDDRFANRFANRSSLRLHRATGLHTGMHTGLQTRLRNAVYVFGHAHLHVYDAVSAACRWKRSTRSNIYIYIHIYIK